MLGRNKKKIHYKVRFQNQNFKKRLELARGYKRPTRSIPENGFEILLSRIGLASWVSRIVTLLVFFFIVYLVYIPNIFFIKHINISGISGDGLTSAQFSVNSYLDKKLPWPQKNIVFLSKNGLSNFLLKNNQNVLKINSIHKIFPSTLTVDISPRINQFAIQTNLADYSLANDGLVTGVIDPNASGTLPSNLTLIKLDNSDNLVIGKNAFSQENIAFINKLQSQIPGLVKSDIKYYQLTDLKTPDLSLYLTDGLKLVFDINSNQDKTLSRLKLLLTQFSDSDIKNLFYIDLRFEDKAYTCNKSAPCVKDINLPSSSASNTPFNISN